MKDPHEFEQAEWENSKVAARFGQKRCNAARGIRPSCPVWSRERRYRRRILSLDSLDEGGAVDSDEEKDERDEGWRALRSARDSGWLRKLV